MDDMSTRFLLNELPTLLHNDPMWTWLQMYTGLSITRSIGDITAPMFCCLWLHALGLRQKHLQEASSTNHWHLLVIKDLYSIWSNSSLKILLLQEVSNTLTSHIICYLVNWLLFWQSSRTDCSVYAQSYSALTYTRFSNHSHAFSYSDDNITSMMEHPYIPVGMSHGIWLNSSLADRCIMVAYWIDLCSLDLDPLDYHVWRCMKSWHMTARWVQNISYFSEFLMQQNTLITLLFFVRLHVP
jgi:hypothetical protein